MKRFFSLFSLIFVVVLSTFAQATTKVAFLSLGGDSQSEINAKAWFTSNYGYTNKSVITDFDDIKNYDVVWIHLDRINLGKDDLYFTPEQIQKIGAFVKNGGRLLLTTQATKLVAAMGRTNGYAPNVYGNGTGSDNPDVWGVNAIGNNTHAIYLGLETARLDNNDGCYPLINGCFKLDHNCMWNLEESGYNMSVDAFESATNSRVLGTWQQRTDFNYPAIVEFYPNATWKGVILACGIAAFDWNASEKHDNFTKFAANMINYVKDCNIDIQYPSGYTLEGVPNEKTAADQDNAVYKYNPTTKTAYLYDVDHEKMYIRNIPRFITYNDTRYEVIGIDPRMKEIPLKYVDLDQGHNNNRESVHFSFDVALNPHDYFSEYVIVYVCDRDFREGDFDTNADRPFVKNGEATDPNSVNICIASRVNTLKMEDKHPLMFPGKGAPGQGETFAEGHAFDVKKIIFERVFTPGVTSTLILPFSLTEEEANAFGTFYDFTSYDSEANQLNFTKHSGATDARTPYIFLPKVATMPVLEYSDWSNAKPVFRTIGENAEEYDTSIDQNPYEFHGSFEFLKVYGQAYYTVKDTYWEYATMYGNTTANGGEDQTAQDLGIYAYNDGNFQTSKKWIGMRTFRCYIKLKQTQPQPQSQAKRMSVMARFIEDNVTGISQVESSNTGKADGRVFNIMGQRIDASQSGLQIVNGKKYFKRK